MVRNKKNINLVILSLCIIFSLAIISNAVSEERPTLYWGSSGSSVSLVQNRLISWGYLSGSADGVFGSTTAAAVKSFQAKNGLGVDGVVGDSTWNALGFATTAANTGGYVATRGVTRSDDANMLARLVDAEAENEPYVGKVAVAAVILNRVSNPNFPKSIASVIFKGGEFESVSNGRINSISPSDEDLKAAQDALNGWDPSYGALFFWNPSKPVSGWIWSRQIIATYGRHVFGK